MKVYAKNDDVKKVLYHPTAGRFRDDGTADWPEDTYTARRIADGDISTTEPAAAETSSQQPASRARHGRQSSE